MSDVRAQGASSAWSRLRRRKVVQWGLAYVAGAWALLQGIDFLVDTFHWPDATKQIATIALAIGLPVALVLAWYHGDRGQQRVGSTELTILAALLALGGFVLWQYEPATEAPTTATARAPAPTGESPNPKSIAVLPFADMSPEKDQEYMSDGIAEELLNLLAKVPDLKVIARTSSFAFKGEKIEVAEIAKRLNVAHVLEGSVRKAGNTVRITAQLIRASDSTHLWSERYDRPLDDIFAVQDEIANAIVQNLQMQLTGAQVARREAGTHDLDAYQLYLRAVSAHSRNTEASLQAEIDYLERAIKLDPNYALAWLQLSFAVVVQAENGFLDATEGFERARSLAQHALQLNPELPEAYAVLQGIHTGYDWDWDAAEIAGKKALALDPMNPDALLTYGRLSSVLGRWDEAERQFRAGLVRDPLSTFLIWNLANNYYRAGRLSEAASAYQTLLELEPDFLWTRGYYGKTLLAMGQSEAALEMVQREADVPSRLLYLPVVLHAVGRHSEADEAQKAQIETWADTAAFYVAESYAYRGEPDRAMEWLERAYRQKDVALNEILGEPLFSTMTNDPRFKAFLRKMKLPEWPSKTITAAGS
jgi:TolB-like protein